MNMCEKGIGNYEYLPGAFFLEATNNCFSMDLDPDLMTHLKVVKQAVV